GGPSTGLPLAWCARLWAFPSASRQCRPVSADASRRPQVLTVPDVIKPGLRVLFCGINPGLMSGARGQHFARPGNRFWKVLHLSGFPERVLAPAEQWSLLDRGIGVTNLVSTTTRSATDLTAEQLREGAALLEKKVAQWQPAFVAVLGMQAFRTAFRQPGA